MPIRRRVLTAILLSTLAVLFISILTSVFFMLRLIDESEGVLSDELERNLSAEVVQKASKTDVQLSGYVKHIEFLRDYIQNMYKNYDELVAAGRFVDSPRTSVAKDEFAMTSTFANENPNIDEHLDEIRFFSNLESVMEPIAKENDGLIDTLYLGTIDGLLISYDKYSYLSYVEEPNYLIYDYMPSQWYSKGIHEEGVFFTDLYVDSMGRGLTVTVAAPFKDQDGVVRGVVAADFAIIGLYDEMISMDLGGDSSSFAIDKSGEIITVESDEEITAQEYTHLSDAEVQLITSGNTGILAKDDAFYAYAPVQIVGWTLCAKVPRTVLMERVEVLEDSFRAAIIFFLLISVALVLASVFLANRVTRSITQPIEMLVDDIQVIAGGNLEHKAAAVRNDEIGDMTSSLNEMVERLKGTMRDLVAARDTAEKMHELANKDSLTGLGNRTAYDGALLQLGEGLQRGDATFGVVMIDLNYLKVINDTYGHENGNNALKKLSELIVEVFGPAPAFRIGGDEFVIILKGAACDDREALVELFDQRIEALGQDDSLEPWERLSAAIGSARYDESQDETIESVFVRADAAMYERKRLMKAAREN